MRHESFDKIAMVSGNTPEEFESNYNRTIEELAEHKITGKDVRIDLLRAAIFYTVTQYYEESVADEFHNEGLCYLCRQCPHLPEQKDKRVKRVDCKYAELGRTHLDHECCEMFYRELKQGKITPRYIR